MKKTVAISCLLAAALLLTACGGSRDPLEGTWMMTGVRDNGKDVGIQEQMEAVHGSTAYTFSQGKLTMEIKSDEEQETIECTYEIREDRMTVQAVKVTLNGQTYDVPSATPTPVPAEYDGPAQTATAADVFAASWTYTYNISGNTLTLLDGDGVAYLLTRK